MPTLEWNAATWGGAYPWPEGGEEWSFRWGGSEAQWFGALYPRIHRLLPAPRILEIAPGFGRWSKFLFYYCSDYLGIDLNQNCTDTCMKRFASEPKARFVTNDGLSLDAAEDGAYDLIFSFDSLVHAELDVFDSYIPQIISKLSPRGMAFIHHSNLAARDMTHGKPTHGRATTVSGEILADLIDKHGGATAVQEVISWVNTGLLDCLTVFGRKRQFSEPPIKLRNPSFIDEADLIKTYHAPYNGLSNFVMNSAR